MRQGIAMALIVALGIVGGSALSEIGEADAGPQQERQLRQVVRTLKVIQSRLGGQRYAPTINEHLAIIRSNTYGACTAVGGGSHNCNP